jgi:hypothetical protein
VVSIFSEIVEQNGKTIKENNLEIQHKIPIGALVEVKHSRWHGDGACEKIHARLYVIRHMRDCDGSPLYVLSPHSPAYIEKALCDFGLLTPEQRAKKRFITNMMFRVEGGFGEESLKVVKLTEKVKRGDNVLRWEDE